MERIMSKNPADVHPSEARGRAQMKGLSGYYTGHTVLIYDTDGNHLDSTTITSYDKMALRIEVQALPSVFSSGAGCRVLIMTSPSPCEYQGRALREGTRLYIAMYQGQEKESRGAERYKINSSAVIENLVCDGRAYPLLAPLEITLVNISKSGVRFRAPLNSLSDGDRFQMRMKISDSDKLLIADVINHHDIDEQTSEYGCQFLIGSERVV